MDEALPRRIAVVHDWLIDFAGAERALAEILRCFPDADLYSLFDHLSPHDREALGGRRARTGFLQSLPGIATHHKYYLPLMPLAVEQIDVTAYELVISSSHAVAKGVIVSPDALHVSYVYSPMRYAWDHQFTYLAGEGMERGARGALMRVLLHRLRAWDHRSAAGVDHFLADSKFIQRRILKAYRREAEVLYPPVDVETFRPGGAREDYYVTVSRLWPYKRTDLIVEAFASMPARRLVVIGDGPCYAKLRRGATSNVELLGHRPLAELVERLQRARAFVFAALEDFGIAPVEALACGTPVIAYGRGGVAETVAGLDAAEPTGVLYDEQSAAAIVAAVETFETNRERITPEACRRRAERFAPERFRSRLLGFVRERYAQWVAARTSG
jgi:glycosyltransferase involved in cell wall biosynthesis